MKNMKKKNSERQKLKNKLKKKINKQDNDKEINKFKKKKPINFKKLNKRNKNREQMGSLSKKNRIKLELFSLLFLLILLTTRIGYIQFVQGEELKSMAYVQQMLNRSINPKRGTIYDSTRKSNTGYKFKC